MTSQFFIAFEANMSNNADRLLIDNIDLAESAAPTPTPAPTPTSTPVPTPTLVFATPTPVPTPTAVPTPTPVPIVYYDLSTSVDPSY